MVAKAKRPILESIDEADSPATPQNFDEEFLKSECVE